MRGSVCWHYAREGAEDSNCDREAEIVVESYIRSSEAFGKTTSSRRLQVQGGEEQRPIERDNKFVGS